MLRIAPIFCPFNYCIHFSRVFKLEPPVKTFPTVYSTRLFEFASPSRNLLAPCKNGDKSIRVG